MTGLYVPGSGWLHRAPAGAKLLGLAVATTLLAVVRSPAAVGAGAVALVVVVATSRLRPGTALAPVWSLRWLVVVLVPFQLWAAGPRTAVVVVGTLVVAVAAASLVTTTTRVADMLDVLVSLLRPLRRAGVDPERMGLLLALALRSVPVLAATADEVRQARRARGLERSLRALLVPLVVRSVRHADRMGEALAARGVDD